MRIDSLLLLLVALALISCKKEEMSDIDRFDLDYEVVMHDTKLNLISGNDLSFYSEVIFLEPENVLNENVIGYSSIDESRFSFINGGGYQYTLDSIDFVEELPTDFSAVLLLGKGDDVSASSTGLNYFLQHPVTNCEVAICTYKRFETDSVELKYYGDGLMDLPISNSEFIYDAYGEEKSGENYTLDAIYKAIQYVSENGKYGEKYVAVYYNELPADAVHSYTDVISLAKSKNVHLLMLSRYDDEFIGYEMAVKTEGLFTRYARESLDFSLAKLMSKSRVHTRIYITLSKTSPWTIGSISHSFDYDDQRIYYKIWY